MDLALMKSRNWIILISSFTLLFTLCLFFLRQPLLDYAVTKAAEKFREHYQAELIVGDRGFLGFRDVYLRDIRLIPKVGDTLFTCNSFKARVSLRKLLRLRIGFKQLIIDTANVTLIRRDSSDNFSFFIRRQGSDNLSQNVSRPVMGFDERTSGIVEAVNSIFDEQITFRQFRIIYRRGLTEEMVSIPELYFDGSLFQSNVITSSKEGVNLWQVKGTANPDRSAYRFKVERIRGEPFALPFVDLIDNFKISFDSASVDFRADPDASPVEIQTDFTMSNLLVNHWRISPVDVVLPRLQLSANAFASVDSVGLRDGSTVVINRLPLQCSFYYSRNPQRRIRLSGHFNADDAGLFFSALPEGMFSTFRGFRAKGGMAYNVFADIPIDSPASLQFRSELKKKDFSILAYGAENFSKINLPFSFLAVDGERPVRSFVVGPENPYFTPLPFISPYLVNCVLTAEDPGFMQHGGFVEEAFRESMATNMEKRRFVRGGSTISMQLVKNVFLSRDKTVSRKLEEALIVWLIEQGRLVSKERMLEVYLNIIEWGPNVYGVGEASRFYFSKTPDELTLAESIFLASLIPSPKQFRYRFDTSGQLKPYMQNFFKVVSDRLVRREKISQAEADSLVPSVRLSGPAMMLVQPDTLQPDSTELLPFIMP